MREFWTYITNSEYKVGCTGQTVYLFDKNNTELAKFRDLKYAYHAAFSPKGDVFVVRSNEGRLAVYNLAERRLTLKVRYANGKDGDEPQDENGCFSSDGERFYIILSRADLCSSLLIYQTSDFSLEKRLFDGDNMVLSVIEYDTETDGYYLLGFIRNTPDGENTYFVAQLEGDSLTDIEYISENEHTFYREYKEYEATGFSPKSQGWRMLDDIDNLKGRKYSLAKLWLHYCNKRK